MNELRRCGALWRAGGVDFRVWAPVARRVELVLHHPDQPPQELEMTAQTGGYFALRVEGADEGQRYAFRIDGGEQRADPCSLHQPDNVPGPSEVVRTDLFRWSDQDWRGIPPRDLAIYELHVGTFTPEGTFEAIIPRLPALRELGITAIELLPVGQFPGARNWGYDGVLPYAAQNTYGGPRALARLVDAAHAAGLAVLLDVVYNHFGPEHNYLSEFGPYLVDCYHTPWGMAVNYDQRFCDPVREYVLENARMWLQEFHLDGLRLDAVHAIYDMSARPILQEIAALGRDVAAKGGRAVHIIGESDQNDPRVVSDATRGGIGLTAQWADDFHHALHSYLVGEQRGYYSDFGSPAQIARALETPFVFDGIYSENRKRRHGAPTVGLPPERFVVCIQNHDQVGNRAIGERLSELLVTSEKQRAAAALLLLCPYVPLLFMGEEYGELRRFPFFCSFGGEELLQAVREGRRREFADFVASVTEIPDPGAPATFASAILSWDWPEGTPHGGLRKLYGDLLHARRQWPLFRGDARRARIEQADHSGCLLIYERGGMRAVCNLSAQERALDVGRARWTSESPRYGGRRRETAAGDLAPLASLLPFEVVVVDSPAEPSPQ